MDNLKALEAEDVVPEVKRVVPVHGMSSPGNDKATGLSLP
jgi:hypothetical protein